MPRNANQSKSSNYSLHQPGQADYIETDYSINGLTQITVSCWIKTTTNQPNEHIWSFPKAGSGSGLGLQFGSSANTGYSVFNYAMSGFPSVTDTSSVYNDGNWHNIIFTSSLTEMKLYVDGFLINTTSITATAMSGTIDKFFIGSFSNTSPQFNAYNISFSDVCIFDHALSPSQVTTLWGGGTEVSNPMALPSSPIAYYPLGGSAGAFRTPVNVNDQWLIENNAIGDYVFDFDAGSSQYISTTDSISGFTSFTISAWANAETLTTADTLVGQWRNGNTSNSAFLMYLVSNTMHFYIGSGSSAILAGGDTTLSTGQWYHFCATWDGTTTKLYINGVQESTTGSASSMNTTTVDLLIGAYNNSAGTGVETAKTWNGEISNTQIFNIPLSGPEVETLYNYGSPIQTLANIPQSSNLKAWYKLDATEIYNNSTTEWSIDNNQNPSAYPSSLDFNGSSNYINLDSFAGELSTGDAYGLSVWFKGDGNNNTDGVLFSAHTSSRGNVVRLLIRDLSGSTHIQYLDGGNNGAFQGNYDNNKWHNVVVTKSTGTSTLTLYIDGSSIGTISNCNPDFSNATLFSIGQEWDASGTGDFFSGQISNVQIFNTALTDGTGGTVNQIETLYNNGTPLADMSSFSSLVSWWKLNNTTTGIEDSKGSNNGTNNGATEYAGFVNTLVGDSSGMSQSNLVQSDLQTVAPYSKYALSFDSGSSDRIDTGAKILNNMTSYTASIWAKGWSTSTLTAIMSQYDGGSVSPLILTARHSSNTNGFTAWLTLGGTFYTSHNDEGFSDNTKWVNLTVTWDGSDLILYVNGIAGDVTSASGTIDNSTTYNFHIGGYSNVTSNSYDGQLSNCSVWNTALTQSQVTEIYNEGLPSNLNSHSAYSNLISWWQLGENSSFNGNDWIVADEIGSNNGESDGMGVDALTNGVGTTANGVSSGMSEGSLVGDAPYSTANAISSGMPVTARGTDVPPTP